MLKFYLVMIRWLVVVCFMFVLTALRSQTIPALYVEQGCRLSSSAEEFVFELKHLGQGKGEVKILEMICSFSWGMPIYPPSIAPDAVQTFRIRLAKGGQGQRRGSFRLKTLEEGKIVVYFFRLDVDFERPYLGQVEYCLEWLDPPIYLSDLRSVRDTIYWGDPVVLQLKGLPALLRNDQGQDRPVYQIELKVGPLASGSTSSFKKVYPHAQDSLNQGQYALAKDLTSTLYFADFQRLDEVYGAELEDIRYESRLYRQLQQTEQIRSGENCHVFRYVIRGVDGKWYPSKTFVVCQSR